MIIFDINSKNNKKINSKINSKIDYECGKNLNDYYNHKFKYKLYVILLYRALLFNFIQLYLFNFIIIYKNEYQCRKWWTYKLYRIDNITRNTWWW